MLRLSTGGYEPHPALCVLATYFNAAGYRTPRENFLRFVEPLLLGRVNLIVIEGRHAGVAPLPLELGDRTTVVSADCESGLWQKERLLNLGLERVPDTASAVAWLDGDILFADRRWIPKTLDALSEHPFVQPFDDLVRLPEHPEPAARMIVWVGYGFMVGRDPGLAAAEFGRHGHTGLAWAGRRDLVAGAGFYDRWPAGTGDHLMAHAMTGTSTCRCIRDALGADSAAYRDYLGWAPAWDPGAGPSIGCVEGAVFHLWHGDYAKRSYPQREAELRAIEFDPSADLALTAAGSWRPGRRADVLTQFADSLVRDRAEDG